MKTTLLFLSVFLSAHLFGQDVYIPDANFKAWLVGNNLINTNSDTEIQLSEASAFTGTIDCSGQSIYDLTGIEAFTALTELYCHNNQLTSLDLSSNSALEILHCASNQLTYVDVASNTALINLNCQGNQLTSLNISSNIDLESIYCGLNQLTSLDLSSNTSLTFLDCFGNQLTSLDVSNNTSLGLMGCGSNQLASLDVSNNTVLTVLSCINNQLECLNLKNGNNAYLISLSASGNPNLTCIEVDDVNYSTTNWTSIDAQTSFSMDCNNNGCSCVPSFSSITAEGLDTYTAPSGAVYTTEGIYMDTILNAAGCDSIITINLSMNFAGIMETNTPPKQLIRIVDILGRATPFKPNIPLIYVYDDGSIEKVFSVEY